MAVGAPQDDACQIPSTNQNFGRSPSLHRRAPNVSRAGRVVFPQRTSRGLPECSAVACPTPQREFGRNFRQLPKTTFGGSNPLSPATESASRVTARSAAPLLFDASKDLLALLHAHAPAKVDAVARHRRRVEHGRLSVGLKMHCLGDGSQFSTLVEGLGGAQKILDVNYYKHSLASLCLVLPPVGSARSAILLLECIEHFIGSALFSNPEIQIQVCSPGRLDARRSALLAIGFYLGSDTLRRYTLGDLATSF